MFEYGDKVMAIIWESEPGAAEGIDRISLGRCLNLNRANKARSHSRYCSKACEKLSQFEATRIKSGE